jgi:hypothetical protein
MADDSYSNVGFFCCPNGDITESPIKEVRATSVNDAKEEIKGIAVVQSRGATLN